jgi:uncharacterized membrane protein YgcG
MVKGWADHCSSDDEEDHKEREELLKEEEHVEAQAAAPIKERKERNYVFPSEPPFTAFVGNLAYNVVDSKELAEEITRLAKECLDVDIVVESSRIMMERGGGRTDKPRHRGFGYVTVATVEQLQALMKLNDDSRAMLAGRKVQLDTANASEKPRRSSGAADVDGSKFRGGKYKKDKKEEVPMQRTSLNLKPRSKPVADEDHELGGSSSNIFGGGKARDEKEWAERRKSEKQEHRKEKRGSGRGHGGEGRGGSGGRGSMRGGGGGSAGRGGRAEKNGGRGHHEKPKQEKKPAAPPIKTEPERPTPSVPKVTNKFAALGFDSDSD